MGQDEVQIYKPDNIEYKAKDNEVESSIDANEER